MSEIIQKFQVSLFGEKYLLISDEPEEKIEQVVDLVNSCISEISQKSKSLEQKKIAVYTAIHLASQLLKLKSTVEEYNIKSDNLVKIIDKVLILDKSN